LTAGRGEEEFLGEEASEENGVVANEAVVTGLSFAKTR
jgi:hypothetical protein